MSEEDKEFHIKRGPYTLIVMYTERDDEVEVDLFGFNQSRKAILPPNLIFNTDHIKPGTVLDKSNFEAAMEKV